MPFPLSDNMLQQKQIDFRYKSFSASDYTGFYHYHRGIEFLFVHQGHGHLVLDRKMYTLEPGSIQIIQPFQLHRVQFDVSDRSPYERSIITFEPSAFLPFFEKFPALHRYFEHVWKDELPSQVFRTDSEEPYINSVMERFHQKLIECAQQGKDHMEASSMLIIAIFDYLQSLHQGSFMQGTPRAESYAEKIMQWVEDHYTEPFELDQLAQELHLSKHYVSHLFRTDTGSSITDYVIARRIRQACWLLRTESVSVEHIGARVGIPHFSYFCRLFKKITGFTPNQYRNSL